MTEGAAFTYRLTDEGDLVISGEMPDFDFPEHTPYYPLRERILRVVAMPGTRVGKGAFSQLPTLRVAVLSEARSVGMAAFRGCPMLAAVQLSPRTTSVAPDAFSRCPRLFCLDYSGRREFLDALLAYSDVRLDRMLLRTLPPLSGNSVKGGSFGSAEWTLDDTGVLTVLGGDIPDLHRREDAPWYSESESIRHVVLGEQVGRVGEHAFSALPALTALTVTGKTVLGAFSFASCHKLSDIALFCAVEQLDTCAFAGIGAGSVFLGPSVRHLPEGLLQSALGLRSLMLPLLPLLSAAPFLSHCTALKAVRFCGTEAEYKAMPAAPRLPSRARLLCFDPANGVDERVERAFQQAEQGLHTAAASYGTAAEALRLASQHFPRLLREVDEAEREYLALQRGLLGLEAAPDISLEGLPYKKRKKLLKRRNKEQREALREATRREKENNKLLSEHFDVFVSDLKHAMEAAGRDEADFAKAEKAVCALRPLVDGLYPLDGIYRPRLLAMQANAENFSSALPSDILPNAVTTIGNYRMLLSYRRYDALRDSLERARLLIEEQRTKDAEKPAAAPRVPPCILVVGGEPGEDPSVDACVRALRRAGAVTACVKPGERHLTDKQYDALVLCDGPELASQVFGGHLHGVRMDDRRARRDSSLFSAFYLYGKPVLGIGRGCQQINMYLGGTLRRDVSSGEGSPHAGRDGKPIIHDIRVTPDSALSTMYDLRDLPLRVPSDHTSVIRTLGRELVAVAKAPDGVIEAFVHRRLPILGVQFALDRMPTDKNVGFLYPVPTPADGMTVFSAFVALACRVREKPPVPGTEDRFTSKTS